MYDIIEKQLEPFISAVNRSEEGALEALVNAIKTGPPGFSEYIHNLSLEGNAVAIEAIEKMFEMAADDVDADEEEAPAPNKSKFQDINMDDVALNEKAIPVSNVKLDWHEGCGEENLYMRLHLPSEDETKNEDGRKLWVTSIQYCGEHTLAKDIHARIAGFYKSGEEIESDSDGNKVYASGKYPVTLVGNWNKVGLPKISRLLKKRVEVETAPINSAVVVGELDEDGHGKKMLGKILLSSVRGSNSGNGKPFPYDIEALYAEPLPNSAFRVSTKDGGTYYILKWNLGNFKGSVLDE